MMQKSALLLLCLLSGLQVRSQQRVASSRGMSRESQTLMYELTREPVIVIDPQTDQIDTTKANNEFLKRKIKSLQNQSQAYNTFEDKAAVKASLQEAIRLAQISGNRSLVNQTKLAYASRIASMNETGESLKILKSLLPETSFSPAERVHMLCLLIINSMRVNSSAGLQPYYAELKQTQIARYPKYKTEYLLAIAMYSEGKKEYKEATAIYASLLTYLKTDPANRDLILEAALRLASLYSVENNSDAAEVNFKLVLQNIAKLDKYHPLRISYLRAYNAHLNRFRKTDQLIRNMTSELLLKDSLYRQELLNTTKELMYRFRLQESQKNLQIMAQKRQLDALQFSKNKQQSLIVILALAFAVIVATLFIYMLVQRRKQSALLHNAELEKMKQVYKIEKVKLLAESQEAERRRIAGQLHDEVGSMLSVARLNLSSVKEEQPDGISPEQLETANKILGDVAYTIREMSHQLMPVAIKEYGLKHAVEQLISDINMSGKLFVEQIIVGMDEPDKYPEEFQVSIYRIIQELLNNTMKHSGAKNALFQLIEHKDSVNLLIEDNGNGFDPNAATMGRGIELLQSRIAYYEGTISIETGKCTGTMILIDIPVSNITNAEI